MKRLFLFIIVFETIFFASCSLEKKDEYFPSSEMLSADSIAINEMLNPTSVELTEFYAVVCSPKTSKVIYRYSIPDWTFMDTTFSKGEGPEDMIYPIALKSNTISEDVWVFDQNKYELRLLHLSPEDVTMTKKITDKDVITPIYAWYGKVVNNRYLIERNLNRTTGETYMYSYDLSDSLRVKDSLLTLSVSQIKEVKGGWSATTTNVPTVNIYGGRMMLYYSVLGASYKYSIAKDGTFTLEKVFGQDYTYQEVKNMDMEQFSSKANSYANALGSDDKYIYMLRVAFDRIQDEEGKSIKVTKTSVEVYTWDMEPVKEFVLNKTDACEVYLDVAHSKFYAWDTKNDFEQVYVYDFSME
ncbi:MAG: hypothetical protein PHD21_08170 [Flavobacteriales bacterium]|nr:hypothetical protein [Flavobacteriales bacterium]